MKRMLLVLAAAVFFLNAAVIPNLARADGPMPNCNPGQVCKP
jgi:hypothetical protein